MSPGAVDREGVSLVDFGDDAQSDVYMVLRPHSPVDMSSDSQIVVKSTEPLDMSMVVDRVAQFSQLSGLSSVQLSPNRVCEDYTYNTLDVFPLFQVSPEAEGYFPDTSPVTPPNLRNLPKSPYTLAHGYLPPEATGSLDSFVGSPVTSLSLT